MKNMETNTKLKRGLCVALATFTVMTATAAIACTTHAAAMTQPTTDETPVKTAETVAAEDLEAVEDFNIIFTDCGEIGENGEVIFDLSNIELLEEGLNLISFPEAIDEEEVNYVYAEDFDVNEDGYITINADQLDLEEGLNLISFPEAIDEEEVNYVYAEDFDVNEDGYITINADQLDLEEGLNLIWFENDEDEEIDPEFSFTTPEDEAIDEEMFVEPMATPDKV